MGLNDETTSGQEKLVLDMKVGLDWVFRAVSHRLLFKSGRKMIHIHHHRRRRDFLRGHHRRLNEFIITIRKFQEITTDSKIR